MIHYMMGNKIKWIIWLQYGHLIIITLRHIGFKVEDEEFSENSAMIENDTVEKMNIEINNRVLTQNPHKFIRSSQSQQAQ